MGAKITLGDVRERDRGAYLVIYCVRTPGAPDCHHSGVMHLLHAITLWGEDARLDDLPLRCSRCGSRNVDVRADHPRDRGGNPVWE